MLDLSYEELRLMPPHTLFMREVVGVSTRLWCRYESDPQGGLAARPALTINEPTGIHPLVMVFNQSSNPDRPFQLLERKDVLQLMYSTAYAAGSLDATEKALQKLGKLPS